MIRQFSLSTVLAVAVALRASAQAPNITQSGDPSVRADSIYALAVSPADNAAYGAVVLFEDEIFKVERSGATRRTSRSVVQVLKQASVEYWGQWNLSYRPDRERLRVNWVKVVRPDGTVLSDKPSVDHETQESVDENSVYSGRTVRQLTLAAVAPGTIVDVSYTIETFRPTLPGDFDLRWVLNQDVPVRRERFMVDAPAGQRISIITRNLTITPSVTERGGRTIHSWTAQEVPAFEMEPYAGYPNSVFQQIRISGWNEWTDVGDWFARISSGRDRTTQAVERAFAEVAGSTKDVDSLLLLAQRWVAQDFRYVSVGLGDGNYQPRLPSEVVASRLGDCKDKAMLFIALARSFGVDAWAVLLNSQGLQDSAPVSLERFDHAIAVVERDGELVFLDLTDDLLPYGNIPPRLEGTYGLVVRPNGKSEWVQLPESVLEENWIETRIAGTIRADATFGGWLEIEADGSSQYGMRERLRGITQKEDDDAIETARNLASSYLPGVVVDSASYNDGLSLTSDAYIHMLVSTDRLVQPVGQRFLLALPGSYIDASTILGNLGTEARRFPIDANTLNDNSTASMIMEITLPPGWRAELPPPVSANGLFGVYRASYTQKGRTLRIERELSGRRGIEPPDSIEALRTWLRGVAEDRAQSILLDPAGGGYQPDSNELFTVPTADTGRVTVTFGWPLGMEADVSREEFKIVQEGAKADTTVSRTSYTLKVAEHPEGRLVSYANWGGSTDADSTIAAVVERLGAEKFIESFHPALVIGPDGELLRIEGFGPVREVLDSLLRPQFDSLPNPSKARQEFLDRVLSEDFLLAKQQEEWNPLVYSWNSIEFEIGAVYEKDDYQTSPIIGNNLLPFHMENGLMSRVPCRENSADTACVLLVMRHVPDPDALAPIVIGIMQEAMGVADSVVGGWQMSAENIYQLVTEPSTMIPHRLDVSQTVHLTRPDSSGGVETLGRQEVRRRFVFSYKSSAPASRVDARLPTPGVSHEPN